MPNEVDFTGEANVSWHAIEQAERNGADRVVLSGEQVRMLTQDLMAIAGNRKRVTDSVFAVDPRGVLFQCSVCGGLEMTGGWIPIPHSGHGGKWMVASAALTERWTQAEAEPNHGKWG
jgi:hypothetical protein